MFECLPNPSLIRKENREVKVCPRSWPVPGTFLDPFPGSGITHTHINPEIRCREHVFRPGLYFLTFSLDEISDLITSLARTTLNVKRVSVIVEAKPLVCVAMAER